MEKNIIILIGRGKSTLTDFILRMTDDYRVGVYYSPRDVKKKEHEIKPNAHSGIGSIIHLENEEEIKKLGLGIRRRALIFKLDF